MGDYLGQTLSGMGVGIFMPFMVAAALKSAQGSSTVALVTTSAIVANLLPELGLDSSMGRVLTVMAIGAGAMTVSHANDSYFWVVSQDEVVETDVRIGEIGIIIDEMAAAGEECVCPLPDDDE